MKTETAHVSTTKDRRHRSHFIVLGGAVTLAALLTLVPGARADECGVNDDSDELIVAPMLATAKCLTLSEEEEKSGLPKLLVDKVGKDLKLSKLAYVVLTDAEGNSDLIKFTYDPASGLEGIELLSDKESPLPPLTGVPPGTPVTYIPEKGDKNNKPDKEGFLTIDKYLYGVDSGPHKIIVRSDLEKTPEPASLILLGTGLLSLAGLFRSWPRKHS